jgi:hypothetical protein
MFPNIAGNYIGFQALAAVRMPILVFSVLTHCSFQTLVPAYTTTLHYNPREHLPENSK